MYEAMIKVVWVYGLAIVVSMVIAVVIKVIVVVLNALERQPAAVPKVELVSRTSVDEVQADHVAAIAAAVFAMIGSHRIVRIERTRRGVEWSAEGRLAQHASHDISHRPRR
jgi:hypothetical protein